MFQSHQRSHLKGPACSQAGGVRPGLLIQAHLTNFNNVPETDVQLMGKKKKVQSSSQMGKTPSGQSRAYSNIKTESNHGYF